MPVHDHPHKCIDATEVYRLTRKEAYGLAGDCPLCKEFVGFVINNKRERAFADALRPEMRALVTEVTLTKLLDHFNFYERNRVMTSFDQVIKETVSKLEPGQKMQLFSMGELLEAHYPYAFYEVINAVKRGVNLEYVLSEVAVQGTVRDIDLLKININKALGGNKTERHLTVKYSDYSSFGRKDVFYFDDSGIQTDRLIEIAYRMSGPYEGARRLWVRVDEGEREEFIQALQIT